MADNDEQHQNDQVDQWDDNASESSEDSSIEEKDNVWSDVMGAWKQHLLAVVLAVLAASYVHFSVSSTASFETMNAYLHEWMGVPHAHLHSYRRTANISFCANVLDQQEHPSSMKRFDFRVPLELVHVLEAHYRADQLEDNDYQDTSTISITNDEYTCLKEQTAMTTQSTIKGYAWGYQTPSNMFSSQDQPAVLSFTGFSAKFINQSPTPVLLYWDGRGGTQEARRLVGELAPFQALGTATMPGQSFSVSPIVDPSHALARWTVTADTALVVYKDNQELSPKQVLLRDLQELNLEFARHYKVATKRTWLAHFPRPQPMHEMLPADFCGNTWKERLSDGVHNDEYEIKVLSVTPRVFEIANFLSADECNHLLQHAQQQGLEASTVVTGSSASARHAQTRSSDTAWIPRHSNVTDAIYRRAASLLHMDESLFRHRSKEHHQIASHNSLAESLQVVRYQSGQEYTAHHDFVHPLSTNRHQPTRFATLLFYLNTVSNGGETSFPRAANPTNHDGLKIKPKQGTAVLFYNMLPDGNMDDLSQHASLPVVNGEKWMANLWVWDPIID